MSTDLAHRPSLDSLLGTLKVDLVPRQGLRPHLGARILAEAMPV